MKDKQPKFEIIVDGKVTKTIQGWDALEKARIEFENKLPESSRHVLKDSCGGSNGHRVYVDDELLVAHVFAYREVLPFKDKNGEIIYAGDDVKIDGVQYELSEHPDILSEHKGFYLRKHREHSWGWDDYDITQQKITETCEVVHAIYPKVKK